MMETEDVHEKKGNQKLHAIYLSIIFLLGSLAGFLGWKYYDAQGQVVERTVVVSELQEKNDDVRDELEDLSRQFEDLKTSDAGLQKELDEKRAYIEELKKELEKNKNNASVIAKLKKETVTLREIMKGYIVTIDSLGQANNQLRYEKGQVIQTLETEKNRSATLETDKRNLQGRIDKAALLTTVGVKAIGMRDKRSGSKESETSKASRVDKLRVAFDVAENKLTIPGAKDIFVRVITPDGLELTEAMDMDHKVSYGGVTTYFASRKTIDYQNQPLSVLIYCPKPNPNYVFLPGQYIIELIADNAQIGKTTLVLE